MKEGHPGGEGYWSVLTDVRTTNRTVFLLSKVIVS